MVPVANCQRKGDENQPDIAKNRQKVPPDRRIFKYITHDDGVDRESNHQQQQNSAESSEGFLDSAVDELEGG